MTVLNISPAYREFTRAAGLTRVEDFLSLSGVIWCGHPDRNVAHLILQAKNQPLSVFLKKEHRVRRRDRFANFVAGFGWVSKSMRELIVLRELSRIGIRCPQPVASGEDERGRAFLMLREVENAVDLRAYLQSLAAPARSRFAADLAKTLARMHNAGVRHPDLFSKHVLVQKNTGNSAAGIVLIDWQRGQMQNRVGWQERLRDLAALDATLVMESTPPRLRRHFLRVYLDASDGIAGKPPVERAARIIRSNAQRLLQHRRVREMRQPPLANGSQNLIWLNGEELTVTKQFQETIGGKLPDALRDIYANCPASDNAAVSRDDGATQYVWRTQKNFWQWFARAVQGKRVFSPELEQAATIFRLERYRVKTPQLLAVGQRRSLPWRVDSFLIVENPRGIVSLQQWSQQAENEPERRRKQVTQQVGKCLRAIHEAGCVLAGTELMLHLRSEGAPEVSVAHVRDMRPHRQLPRTAIIEDLGEFYDRHSYLGRAALLDILSAYLGKDEMTSEVGKMVCAFAGVAA